MYGYGMGYGMRYGYYGFDWTIVLVLIGALISLWAQGRVTSTFNKYSKVRSRTGMTGADAAMRLLRAQGIYDVSVRPVSGNLTDHYDPRTKVVNLSESVYYATSVAAIGVAAHECGHAIQDNQDYVPLRLRHFLVPVANFGNKLSMPLFILGLVFGLYDTLVPLGIFLFSFAVLFQVVTLPVEFNASSRAIAILGDSGMLSSEEVPQAKKATVNIRLDRNLPFRF